MPLQGAARGLGERAAVLPQTGPGLPVRGALLPRPPLPGRRAGGQRAAQRQRAAAVGAAASRQRPARLRAQLLLGRHLHALPLRRRGAGRRLPRLPAARGARRRAVPPLPAAPLRAAAPRAARPLRGVPRGAGRHAGHRRSHDGRGGLHLRHARLHLPAGGLHHREPDEPRRAAPRLAPLCSAWRRSAPLCGRRSGAGEPRGVGAGLLRASSGASVAVGSSFPDFQELGCGLFGLFLSVCVFGALVT